MRMDGVCKEMAHHIQKQINHAKSIKETKKEMITSACIIYTQKKERATTVSSSIAEEENGAVCQIKITTLLQQSLLGQHVN